MTSLSELASAAAACRLATPRPGAQARYVSDLLRPQWFVGNDTGRDATAWSGASRGPGMAAASPAEIMPGPYLMQGTALACSRDAPRGARVLEMRHARPGTLTSGVVAALSCGPAARVSHYVGFHATLVEFVTHVQARRTPASRRPWTPCSTTRSSATSLHVRLRAPYISLGVVDSRACLERSD